MISAEILNKMFGLPNTTAGHSPSPGTSFSALSTATSSPPSSSSAPVMMFNSQSPHATSSVIVPSPGFPVTIFSQPQIPAISATCLEPQPNNNQQPNMPPSSSGHSLTSLIAATLATSLAAQQQRNQQQQQAFSMAMAQQQQQQQMAAAQNLFSELLLLRSQQQNVASHLPPPPPMPLPFPNNCNSIVGSQQQPMTADHLDQSTALLNSVQQQKTAIDIIQKALEAIAVVNQQQPKLANALGVSPPPQAPPSLLGTNPTASGLTSNLYVHLQQNGVALNQHQQQPSNILQQQQNAQLEQQLLALFTNNHQQQQSPPPNSQQNGLLKANGTAAANLSAATLFQQASAAAAFQHAASQNINSTNQFNSISALNGGNFGGLEQPLDLSQRAALFDTISTSSSSLINIPSGNGANVNHPLQQRCEIRRSASSVSHYKKSNADVNEHFRRTFSGKWPRSSYRTKHTTMPGSGGGRASKSSTGTATKEGSIGETVIEGESEGRDSPMDESRASVEPQQQQPNNNVEVVIEEQQRPPSRPKSRLQHRLGYTLIKKIFTSSDDKQVEEHFRKSLGDDRFKQIRNAQQKKQQQENNAVDKMDKMEANSPQP